jgi:hypothetical protein
MKFVRFGHETATTAPHRIRERGGHWYPNPPTFEGLPASIPRPLVRFSGFDGEHRGPGLI